MIGVIDALLVCVFLFFYVGLFYNLPILFAGVRDFRRYASRKQKKFVIERKDLPVFSSVLPLKKSIVCFFCFRIRC